MRKIIIILCLLLPVAAFGYTDHRGRNLDSLERVAARYTPDKLASASKEELVDYAMLCRELTWGYLQIDATKCVYYGRQAIRLGEQLGGDMTVFDASILVGQTFWAREQYDSARVYYNKAAAALASMESDNPPRKENDLDANRSRLWGTMGNFYAVQDSIELASFYYNKAAEIFDKYGDYQQNAILYYNLGDIRMDAGDKKQAKADYDRSLTAARQSGDSLMVAIAMKGQGRWYKENGQMRKALQCLKEAEAYYANHPQEEAQSRSETLDYMTASYDALNKNMRTLAVLLALLLASAAAAFWIVFRLKRTRKELTETAAVLDETIEELRPESGTAPTGLKLTPREKDVVRLLMQDKSTKMIADELGVSYETVVWYRKRLLAKLDVHTSPALIAEVTRRGLL